MIEGNLSDIEACRAACDPVSTVFHQAAVSSPRYEEADGRDLARVTSSIRLLECTDTIPRGANTANTIGPPIQIGSPARISLSRHQQIMPHSEL